jgi:competence protein ComEA
VTRRRSERFVLWLLAVCLCLMYVYNKGHGTSRQRESVAFAHRSSGGIVVRLLGDVAKPGVYRFPDGATVADVIYMTMPHAVIGPSGRLYLLRHLATGDIIAVSTGGTQCVGIALSTMKARERMLLGVPLNPDLMDKDDWDALPGIGPELAQAIVDHRQKNGDFDTFERLEAVPGIGSMRMRALKKYF